MSIRQFILRLQLNRQILGGGDFEKCVLTPDDLKTMKKGLLHEDARGSKKRKIKKFLNWIVPAYRGDVYFTDEMSWDQIDYFGVRRIYIIDARTGDGIVLRKSFREAVKVLWRFAKFAVRTWGRHEKVYREWNQRCGELQTYDFWRNYLDI